jgi:tetratricopeptide (TPR) repeat protein
MGLHVLKNSICRLGILFLIGVLEFGCREKEQFAADFVKGNELYSMHKLEDALVYFEDVISKNRRFKRAYVMAAKCYYYLDREVTARERLETILHDYPEYVDANYWMGRLFYFAGEYSMAEGYLLRVLQEDSGHIGAHYLLGDIYLFEGSFEKALMNYALVEENLNMVALSKIRQGEIYARSAQFTLFREELTFIDRNKEALDLHVLDEAYTLLSQFKADNP